MESIVASAQRATQSAPERIGALNKELEEAYERLEKVEKQMTSMKRELRAKEVISMGSDAPSSDLDYLHVGNSGNSSTELIEADEQTPTDQLRANQAF